MKLTITNFFSNYILHPFTLSSEKERCLAFIASLVCGILSLGLIHASCAIAHYLKNRNIVDQTDSAPSSKSFHVYQKKIRSNTPPHNILDLIEKRIKQTKIPSNASECFLHWASKQTKQHKELTKLLNKVLFKDWQKCSNPNEGMSAAGVNGLLDAYFADKEDCAAISPYDGSYAGKKTPRIAYFPIYSQSPSPLHTASVVRESLEKELKAHPAHRPDKIFLPLFWEKKNICHFTLLMVEPKAEPVRITMINTNGDDVRLFHEYEIAAIEAAKEIYPFSQTARNTKKLYATVTSCAHDIVDLAISLAKVANGQTYIQKKLWPCRTLQEDIIRRVEHAEALGRFFSSYIY